MGSIASTLAMTISTLGYGATPLRPNGWTRPAPLCSSTRRIVGYFALTIGSVRRAEASPKLVRGLPSYPVGMVLLARLAVDRRLQGRGLGALLLSEALRRAVAAGEAVAARLVVIDVVDEDAARFYERYGFVVMPEHALRLYRGTKDIRSSLEEDGGS